MSGPSDAAPKVLDGKRALVTGASGTLGEAIARHLAGQGARVLLHGRSRPEALEALAQSIGAAGGSAEPWTFDIADEAASRAACERMLEAGAVQIVVHNAGIHDDAVFAGMGPERWHRVIDVSLHGFYNVTQPLLLPMLRTRWGRVISVSSVAAIAGNRGQVNYAAAKAGLHGATRALSLEVASRGVTVNCVAPGIIESPMAEAAFDRELIDRLVPARRAGTPDEVAALIAFLAGPQAGYITGQVISINGGLC